jgi:hypothetical protein
MVLPCGGTREGERRMQDRDRSGAANASAHRKTSVPSSPVPARTEQQHFPARTLRDRVTARAGSADLPRTSLAIASALPRLGAPLRGTPRRNPHPIRRLRQRLRSHEVVARPATREYCARAARDGSWRLNGCCGGLRAGHVSDVE